MNRLFRPRIRRPCREAAPMRLGGGLKEDGWASPCMCVSACAVSGLGFGDRTNAQCAVDKSCSEGPEIQSGWTSYYRFCNIDRQGFDNVEDIYNHLLQSYQTMESASTLPDLVLQINLAAQALNEAQTLARAARGQLGNVTVVPQTIRERVLQEYNRWQTVKLSFDRTARTVTGTIQSPQLSLPPPLPSTPAPAPNPPMFAPIPVPNLPSFGPLPTLPQPTVPNLPWFAPLPTVTPVPTVPNLPSFGPIPTLPTVPQPTVQQEQQRQDLAQLSQNLAHLQLVNAQDNWRLQQQTAKLQQLQQQAPPTYQWNPTQLDRLDNLNRQLANLQSFNAQNAFNLQQMQQQQQPQQPAYPNFYPSWSYAQPQQQQLQQPYTSFSSPNLSTPFYGSYYNNNPAFSNLYGYYGNSQWYF